MYRKISVYPYELTQPLYSFYHHQLPNEMNIYCALSSVLIPEYVHGYRRSIKSWEYIDILLYWIWLKCWIQCINANDTVARAPPTSISICTKIIHEKEKWFSFVQCGVHMINDHIMLKHIQVLWISLFSCSKFLIIKIKNAFASGWVFRIMIAVQIF